MKSQPRSHMPGGEEYDPGSGTEALQVSLKDYSEILSGTKHNRM
jgi:hypothetical protein